MTEVQVPTELALEERIEKLEADLATVAWLHAELVYAARAAAIAQLVQQLGPQIQQQLADKLMGALA